MIDGPGFLGFGPSTITWFEGLEANNEKAWFDARRPIFEAEIKRPLTALLDEFASRRGGAVKVFRQNRDVRFSKDKKPYKTNTYGLVSAEGRLPFYASISAQGFTCGTGFYDPSKERLSTLRDAIADDVSGPEFEEALEAAEAAGITRGGETLATAPRGFPKDHPRIALLRHKSMLLTRRLPPGQVPESRAPFEFALETWEALAPARAWLEAHAPA
ncbi:MAG: DUF2461 domain-containing protein [Pseudomonadota bacterium]